MSISSSISSSSSISCWRYDVFLSFRGEDTRRNFTDHLYDALNQRGIQVFKDDKELERGTTISPGLFKAIEESRIFIIVFSRNYAYSTWCLDELVKIVECKNVNDHQIVIPIFYDVEPTMVRKQRGYFQEAFAKYEEDYRENIAKVKKWRDTLKEVANISGWELKDRNESNFIKSIVEVISSQLALVEFETHEELVGINSRLKALRFHINIESEDVRMIGICGMGGLGKTTIARRCYNMISHKFQGSSFLANVRELSQKGDMISLQKQLISQLLRLEDNSIWNVYDGVSIIGSRLRRKKVLLVIDDVDDVEQLCSLAKNRDWFGAGSRIIITSRNEHLLRSHGVDAVYRLEELNDDEALHLFCVKTFKSSKPFKEFVQLSKGIIKYASGLPLALKVLGSFLCGRSTDEWESAIQRLKKDPEKGIFDVLQISYNGLKEIEKKIFLDIACFFNGEDRDYVTKLLDYCGFDPVIGISVLMEKSLITITNKNQFWVHDLLEEMGQQIVMRQSPQEPGRRSRLWMKEDVNQMLIKNTGSEIVEAIIIELPKEGAHLNASAIAFSKMTNLRLLKIRNIQLLEGLEFLPNELKFLDWHGYPLKSLPSSWVPDKIVELNMCYSRIQQMWKGDKPLNKLKFLRLTHCRNLIKTPDFTGVPNLEELILERCTRLYEIHPSLLVHKKLLLLNLKGCTNLMTLPSKIAMKSLKTLVLSSCLELNNFPEIVGSMDCLLELLLDGTAIEELPLSIERLTALSFLTLENCTNLVRLPSTINSLTSLKTLNLSGCSKHKNVLESLSQVECLEEFDISGTAIRKPFSFIKKNLKALYYRGCKRKPSSTSLYFSFPFKLIQRRNPHPNALKLPSLSGLCSLTKLNLSDCNLGEVAFLSNICSLHLLEELDLSKNNFVLLPGTINGLSKLRDLMLEDCKRLQSLPELPSNIMNVTVDGCDSLETSSHAFKLCMSQSLYIEGRNCVKLFSQNSLPFSILKGFLEVKSITRNRFVIVVPGSEIPRWFRYQKGDSSIKFTSPPVSYNNKMLLGYALCWVFHINLPTIKQLFGRHELYLYKESLYTQYKGVGCIGFSAESGWAVSDHLYLNYLPLKFFDSKELCPGSVIRFASTTGGVPGLEVKMCGVHPVYMHQVEEFNQTTNHWSGSTGMNSDDFGPTSSMRSLTYYDHNGAEEASGSGCCDDDEEPQAKRLRNLE